MPAPSDDDLPAFLSLMHHMADLSAPVILPHFRSKVSVDEKLGKGVFDPVTEADRQAEQVIRQIIEQNLPDHAIIGEEFEDVTGTSEYCWIVDPIDGTRAFVMGSTSWGTLVGLTFQGKPLLGMMNQPFTGERFWATPEGSFGRWSGFEGRLQTRDTHDLGQAVITSTCPDLFGSPDDLAAFDALRAHCRMTRFGGDCQNYCLLAMGGVDLVVESNLQAFDIFPLIPIVEQAGGVVTDWQGRALHTSQSAAMASGGHQVIAAATPQVHEAALSHLRRSAQ